MNSKSILFASSNPGKIKEVKLLLKDSEYSIISMGELGFHEEIPETGKTLVENALIKARYIHQRTGRNVLAEDTGLEVEVLGGEPGVYTARYAGKQKDRHANMDLLLRNLERHENRNAQFHAVMALIIEDTELLFHGYSKGKIAFSKKGHFGFGYDPIFIPEGYETTFAEMHDEEKAKLSHRKAALKKVIEYLSENNNQ